MGIADFDLGGFEIGHVTKKYHMLMLRYRFFITDPIIFVVGVRVGCNRIA